MKDFRARHGALPLASRPATPVKAEGTPVRRRAPAAAARKAAPSKAVFFDGYDDDDDWGYGLAANKKRKFKQEFAPLPSIKEESETGCDRKYGGEPSPFSAPAASSPRRAGSCGWAC